MAIVNELPSVTSAMSKSPVPAFTSFFSIAAESVTLFSTIFTFRYSPTRLFRSMKASFTGSPVESSGAIRVYEYHSAVQPFKITYS